jgi:hypothetical protein
MKKLISYYLLIISTLSNNVLVIKHMITACEKTPEEKAVR